MAILCIFLKNSYQKLRFLGARFFKISIYLRRRLFRKSPKMDISVSKNGYLNIVQRVTLWDSRERIPEKRRPKFEKIFHL